MEKKPARELILKLLKEKSSLKQDVFRKTEAAFHEFKFMAKEIVGDIKSEISVFDKRISLEFRDKGEFEFEIRVAGDMLIFYMHTNVFEFDKSHPVWRTSYVRENISRSYCGMINVYNFLNDSFKYNRLNDIGYLIARIFINSEDHYFVEGKRQLGFLYNDFVKSTMDRESVKNIIESTILYCIDFDLFTPPFDTVKEVSVSEMQEASLNMQLKTGKRLGFRFQADTDHPE